MGSTITLNDTLRITTEQGFPSKLDLHRHLEKPYVLADVENAVFAFQAKPTIRLYQAPPVRNFLVQDIEGKWVYWGLVHVLSVTHDMVNKTTSGTYKILYLNTPDEMRMAHHLIDQNPNTHYFKNG